MPAALKPERRSAHFWQRPQCRWSFGFKQEKVFSQGRFCQRRITCPLVSFRNGAVTELGARSRTGCRHGLAFDPGFLEQACEHYNSASTALLDMEEIFAAARAASCRAVRDSPAPSRDPQVGAKAVVLAGNVE